MRLEWMDLRPRILDFSTAIEDTRARLDLGWPCYAYRVAVPVRPAGRLNVFEETVLKLLDNARLDEATLADMLCLDRVKDQPRDRSLVRLVCCRLRDLGMLTEHNEVAGLGRALLEQTEEESLDFQLRFVFRERVSGQVLPIVYGGELRFEDLADWNDKSRFAAIRKGDGTKRLRLLRGRDSVSASRAPTPADVVWATKRHKVLSRQYSLLRLGVAACPPVFHANRMNVNPDPETVYLRCGVVIPSSGDDHRIGDPFGYGFSEILFNAYESLRAADSDEQQFIRTLRTRAFTVRPERVGPDPRDSEARAAVLSRLGDAVRDYPELLKKLEQAEWEFKQSDRPPRSSDEEAHFDYRARQSAQSLSEAIETALAHIATRWRPAASEVLLAGVSQTPEMNGELLTGLARRIGLQTTDAGSFLRVPAGRVRHLRDGDVDLQALVAVTLAAADEDWAHPLRRLADVFGDWLVFVSRLKRMRDAGAHGQSLRAGASALRWLRDETYRTILLLLPGLARSSGTPGPAQAEPSLDIAHDARRRALSRLEEQFGVRWYTGLDTDAHELLIQVDLAAAKWQCHKSSESINVARTINDLSSLLQVLVRARQPASGEEWSGAAPEVTAARRAAEAGLLRDGAVLPPSLAKVNPRRLREALEGRNPSLGATLVAMLLLAPMEWLRGLSSACPGFLAVSDRVLAVRGHGNRSVFMTPEAALTLKHEVYKACTALMDD